MNRLLAAVSAVALMASVGVANAAESQGKIKSVDEEAMVLTLEDGTMFQLSEDVAVENLMPGQEVSVSYETKDGENVADKVDVKE
jgi:hypothetical protein